MMVRNHKKGMEHIMIKKRIVPCIIIVVVTLGCVLLSRPTRILFFMALGVASAFELKNVLGEIGLPVSRALLGAYIAAHGILCWARVPVIWMIALFCLAAFAGMFWGVLRPETGSRFAVGNLFCLAWPYAFYAVILYAAASDAWAPVLLIAIPGTWACDSVALLAGKAFGKHKLAPKVSPNKTWEGSVGGALAAVLAGWLISLVLKSVYPVPAGLCILVTFLASCFGQIGDLSASLIKRAAGVKDYGHIMPEHGGIMDKTDSMLFAVPAAFFCLLLAGVI